LIYDGLKHVSIGSLNEEIYKRTITINGVSKSYSMTGWRIGYLGAPAEIAEAVSRLQSHSTSNPTSISQAAALTALQGDRSCINEMKTAFKKRRDYAIERLEEIKGLGYCKPQGAFYIFVDISKLKISSGEFATRLLDEEKVAVVPGASFGHDDFIRLSFTTSLENLEKGIDRIEKFVGKLNNG
jgi:aspartate aminotransferase